VLVPAVSVTELISQPWKFQGTNNTMMKGCEAALYYCGHSLFALIALAGMSISCSKAVSWAKRASSAIILPRQAKDKAPVGLKGIIRASKATLQQGYGTEPTVSGYLPQTNEGTDEKMPGASPTSSELAVSNAARLLLSLWALAPRWSTSRDARGQELAAGFLDHHKVSV
jgi:hypothetical protein